MPRTPKSKLADLPAIPPELLESFGNGPMTAEAINVASPAFKKALIERALAGEMNHHPGYPSGAAKPADVANQRNGKGAKTVLTEEGPVRIEVPRDRDGSFAPLLIPKHERRFTGFDDKIVAVYARGMTVREIQGFLLRSDNWLVFTSRSYTALVRGYGLRQEFITPLCPQKNSMVERVIRTFKEQCAHRNFFENIQHASRAVGDWIRFYNQRRPH